MNQRLEYATLEWLWNAESIRINYPGNKEELSTGSYAEVVNTLTKMGKEEWEVCSCTSGGNWLFWTLKRSISAGSEVDDR